MSKNETIPINQSFLENVSKVLASQVLICV